MNFVNLFVRKPVFTYVIFIMAVVIGTLNFYDIPVEEEPIIQNTTYYIRINYSSSLEGVERNASTPIEKRLRGIPSVELVTADISHTGCLMRVVFSQDSLPQENLLRIQNAIISAKHETPSEAIITLNDNKSNEDGILTVYFISDKLNISDTARFVTTRVKNILESVNGVSSVIQKSDENDSCKIELIPSNMYMHKTSCSALEHFMRNIGITGSSCNIPSGNSIVQVNIGFEKNYSIEDYPIINKDGYHLLLKDIAYIEKNPNKNNKTNISRINGEEAVILEIQKKPDARLIQVCSDVHKELNKVKKICELNDIKCGVINDKSEFVVRGIHGVYKAIGESIILVCIIIFIFLRSFVLSFIPILAIPLSIVPMFGFMKLFNTTINVYSLFGIVLAIGLVVDDAIVVIENIHKFVHGGYTTYDAVIIGTQQITKSIIAMTITLAIVYMPIFFVNDPNIKSFIDFVVTITISVLISGFVALTATPTLFNQIYRHTPENSHNINIITNNKRWWQKINIMATVEKIYLRTLSIIIKYRYSLFITLYILIIAATIIAYTNIKFEENIEIDRGQITFGINSKRPNDVQVHYVDQQLQNLGQKLRKDSIGEDIVDITTNVSETMKGNDYIKLKLVPHHKRKYTIQEIINRTTHLFKENASDCSLYTSAGTAEYKTFELFLQVYNKSYEELQRKYHRFVQTPQISSNINGLLSTDIKYNIAYKLLINREKCAEYNVQPYEILQALTSINQHKFFRKSISEDIHKIYIGTLSSDSQDKLYDILNLPIEIRINRENQRIHSVVPVKNFIKVVKENELNRRMLINGVYGIGISARLNPNISKTAFYNILDKYNEKQDGSFFIRPDIKEERKIKAMQKTISVFLIAIVLIYLTLSALFESFIAPLSIMLTVPGSALGSLLMLIWYKQKLNIVSVIGLITLVGLITKHGIMLVDYIVRKQNTTTIDHLVIESAINRFRPILMTTICMIIGSIPLMNKATEFSEYKVAIARVLIGGMLSGTILSLYVVPCMYLIIYEIYTQNFIKRENYNNLVDNIIMNHNQNISLEKIEEHTIDNNNDDNQNDDNNNDTKLPTTK